jgi:hypothetical protein
LTNIVQVNTQIQAAPAPATLQSTGAFVSQGATNTSQLTSSLLTQLSDLTPLLAGAQNLTSISYAGGTVTATVAGGHGFPVGDTLLLTIAGVLPSGYNGNWECTITSSTQFTYASIASLGVETQLGVVTDEDVTELVAMATTFFGQGANQAVYVLELGYGSPAQGVATLAAYITANPTSSYAPGVKGIYYAYLVPRGWANEPTYFTSLIQAFTESPSSKLYFFTTATLSNYTSFTTLMKGAPFLIESPTLAVYPANAIVSATWTSESDPVPPYATFTTTTNHGVLPGEWVQISGCTPSTWNGWWHALPGTTGTTLVVHMPNNPGLAGIAASGNITFSAQPAANSTLTLNGVTWTFVTSGATGNQTNIGANLQATLQALATNLNASVSGSLDVATYTSNATQLIITYLTGGTGGNAYTLVASGSSNGTVSGGTLTGGTAIGGTLVANYYANTGIPSTEFTMAAFFWNVLQSAPSSINYVPPFAFRFLFGVTAFPTQGMNALLSTLQTANANVVLPASEGGISENMLAYGTTPDGLDFLEWYAINWAQINVKIGLANLVIDGSNNSQNPLYYDQPGINQLQIRGQAVMNNGVSLNLLLNAVAPAVTAVPFNTYVQENPSAYDDGSYAGLACTITPKRGFISLVFNLVVSFYPTGVF